MGGGDDGWVTTGGRIRQRGRTGESRSLPGSGLAAGPQLPGRSSWRRSAWSPGQGPGPRPLADLHDLGALLALLRPVGQRHLLALEVTVTRSRRVPSAPRGQADTTARGLRFLLVTTCAATFPLGTAAAAGEAPQPAHLGQAVGNANPDTSSATRTTPMRTNTETLPVPGAAPVAAPPARRYLHRHGPHSQWPGGSMVPTPGDSTVDTATQPLHPGTTGTGCSDAGGSRCLALCSSCLMGSEG